MQYRIQIENMSLSKDPMSIYNPSFLPLDGGEEYKVFFLSWH